ncbi:MAG: hypothetical protein E7403_03255 [Ruminococcaceae bacterium]|nr:hypothetical protein [Oscillospiraceae bacterium]
MFNKQLKSQLEKMLQQMSPKQKEKLNSILQNEESLKKAIESIDANKAKDVAKSLNLGTDNIDRIVDEIKENPDIIKNLDKKF